jgi:hypothetical protein
MNIPNRDANTDDPRHHPYDQDDRSVKNLEQISEWLRWRMTDPELSENETLLMHLEVDEIETLRRLHEAIDQAPGRDITEKLSDPHHHDRLRDLTLQWLRAQAALTEAVTSSLEPRAAGNGH